MSISNVNCLCSLASEEDLKSTRYLTQAIDITNDEYFFRVDMCTRQFFENLPKAEKTLVKENECEAEVSGCFEVQFPQGHRNHNPMPRYTEYKDFILDQIGLHLDKSKNCNNGTIKWIIPIDILQDNANIIQTTVIQEYQIKDRKITVIKDACTLLEDYPIDL